MNAEMLVTQEIVFHVNPKDDLGASAPIDGLPEFFLLNGEVTMTVLPDGKSIKITPTFPNPAQIYVQADADLGSGFEQISEIIYLTVNPVVPRKAVNLGITADPPTPKP